MPERKARHFTRRHYRDLQAVIRAHVIAAPIESQEYTLALVTAICNMLAAEYLEFDQERFLRQCALID